MWKIKPTKKNPTEKNEYQEAAERKEEIWRLQEDTKV